MKDELEIKRPKNFNNWPTVWQSCFNDGVEACKAALPSESAAQQRQIDEWREAFDKIVSSYDMVMSQYKHSELSYGIATKALEKYPKA